MTAAERARATGRSSGAGRLLVISYHFGLDGATGGFRWAATTNGLVARGWEIDVITAAQSAAGVAVSELVCVPAVTWPMSVLDATLKVPRGLVRWLRARRQPPVTSVATAEKPSGDAVAFADIEMPAGALSLPSRFSRLVDGLVTMCEHRLWARRAVQAGARLARRHAYDAVIVSSPPHEHHVAGLTLARLWRVPCLADFRDPWALALPHGFADIPATYNRLAERLERRIHREATVVVHNTGPVREAIATIPGCVAKRRASIPNGYDDAPEADTPPAAETFEIVFAGHIYGFMDVRVLLRAVRTFLTDSRIDRSKVRLTFLGTPATLWERPFAEILAHYGLRDCASIRERVNRSEALTIQRRAAVLVVFDYPHPLSVPMKFYDYLQSGGELLLFSRPGSALALAASKVDRTVVEPEDAAGAVAVLHRAWEKWSQCAFPTHQDPHGVHHRRERIAEVDALLRELTGAERA